MLYIIGLGLGDEMDITLRGLEAVRSCDKVYVEAYTSLLSFGLASDGLSRMEKLYGKDIVVADREMVEEHADTILREASDSNVAFLVVGDPFGATTHTDLVVRAKKIGLEVRVIHNASVMNAIGICGLQLYRYGETVSIPFFTDTWRPDSFYPKIHRNRQLGLHTLCLLGLRVNSEWMQNASLDMYLAAALGQNAPVLYLAVRPAILAAWDIRVKEPSLESLCRGKKCYEPPRYMQIHTAINQLLEIEESNGKSAYDAETKCVGIARLGYEDQKIVAGSMKDLLDVDFGLPLHCLVIVGETHPVEEEMLDFYSIKSING